MLVANWKVARNFAAAMIGVRRCGGGQGGREWLVTTPQRRISIATVAFSHSYARTARLQPAAALWWTGGRSGWQATANDASAAQTITPSRGRRSCARRAYFRRRRTRHARSLRRVVTAAAARYFFLIFFFRFCAITTCGEGVRERPLGVYTRVCLRARACVCSGIIALLVITSGTYLSY